MRRFSDALHHGISLAMAREVEIGTSFHQAVEIACCIERIYNDTREII